MKTHNPYISGPADVWYSGTLDDLWVEYKFIVLPKRPDTMILPGLSEIQTKWLAERHAEGRKVVVIIGCKEGGVVFADKWWEVPIPRSEFTTMLMSRMQLASWILGQTMRQQS